MWAVSRGCAAPAGLPKDVETALIGYLEKTIKAKEHRSKAEALALNPKIIKGEGVATDRAPTQSRRARTIWPLRKARQQ